MAARGCPVHWCSFCANSRELGRDLLEGEHGTYVLDGQGLGSVGVTMHVEKTGAGYVFGRAGVYQDLPPADSLAIVDGEILSLAFKLASRMADAINADEWGDVDDAERRLALMAGDVGHARAESDGRA